MRIYNNLEYQCIECQKHFKLPYCWVYPKNRKPQRSGKYCSITCRKENINKKNQKECLVCSAKFTTRTCPSKNGYTLYCSRDCWNKKAKLIGVDLVQHLQTDEIRKKANLSKIRANRIGPKSHSFKRGFTVTQFGYKKITTRYFGDQNNNKLEHRYVMEKHLGRKLTSGEVVHHIDENKQNNDISNLMVMTNSEHTKYHHLGKSKPRKTELFK